MHNCTCQWLQHGKPVLRPLLPYAFCPVQHSSALSSTALPFSALFCLVTGEKLIEHLKKWLDTTKLLETPHSWEPGQESDIAAAILELFHLLPQQASKFLETQGVSGNNPTALHCSAPPLFKYQHCFYAQRGIWPGWVHEDFSP